MYSGKPLPWQDGHGEGRKEHASMKRADMTYILEYTRVRTGTRVRTSIAHTCTYSSTTRVHSVLVAAIAILTNIDMKADHVVSFATPVATTGYVRV